MHKQDKKYLAIWMDNASAHITEYSTSGTMTTIHLDSASTHQQKTESINKSENLMHNKEQHQQSTFYKLLGEKIINFTDVLIFGPSNAKSELYNLLQEDARYSKIIFEVKSADYMTMPQEHAFIKKHFSNLQDARV